MLTLKRPLMWSKGKSGLVDSEMSRDEAAAKASLAALFAKVDTNSNGSLEYKELQCVFGDFADQFLKFCDADDDKAISCDEWLKGILTVSNHLPVCYCYLFCCCLLHVCLCCSFCRIPNFVSPTSASASALSTPSFPPRVVF